MPLETVEVVSWDKLRLGLSREAPFLVQEEKMLASNLTGAHAGVYGETN